MSRTPYFLRKYFHKNIYKTFLVSWVLSIYGRSYLIYVIIGTQIGANFTGKVLNCVLKPIIGKILSKKTPQSQNSKKIILNELFCMFFIR